MTPETKLKNQVKDLFKKLKKVWLYVPQDAYHTGIPDILGTFQGCSFAIELKATTKPSQLQILELHKIQEAGGIAGVLYGPPGTKDHYEWQEDLRGGDRKHFETLPDFFHWFLTKF